MKRTSHSRNLQVHIPSPESHPQAHYDDAPNIKLQRINSTKNVHELKKFIFPEARVSVQRATKFEKIRKLQKQKEQLLESLEILKNGAVSCILEKDQTIAKLKSLLTEDIPSDRTMKAEQVDKLIQYIKDLEDETKFLRQELEISRREFSRDIQQKDQIINQISNELNWSAARIENLEKYDELLSQKLKVMEMDNENLSILLNESQQTIKNHKTQLNKSNQSFINNSQISEINPINESSLSRDRRSSSSLINNIDEQIYECKLKELKEQHQLEVMDLTNFYESRIETLRQLCNQSNLEIVPYLNLNEPKFKEKVPDNISTHSDYSNNTKQREPNLKKKFSFTSLKSNNFMETIDQREELKSPRKSLKEEIPDEDYFFHKRFSAKSLHSESDKKSECCSEQSFKYYEIPNKQKIMEKNFKKQKDNENTEKWDKILWFALGSLAGGSLITLGNKIFK